jgi:hypothetical protein
MKRLIYLLLLISFGATAQTVGIKVAAPIIKNNPSDNTITGYANLLNGGYHTVGTIAGRDSLTTSYSKVLKLSMLCYVTAEDSTYRWNGIVWNAVASGGVQSITPAYGFTSTTPITTSGTLFIDTTSATGLVSKTRLTGALTSKADLVAGKVPFNQLTFNTEKTGLSQGGLLTINAVNTKFDVSSGFGYIVNGHSDPEQPTTTKVTWSAKIANTIPNLATQKTTYVAIDINGDLFLTANPLTATQRRNYIRLGVLVHLDNTVLSYIDNQPVVNLEIGGQVQDILEAFGFKSLSGNRIFPVSTNMKIKKESGRVFKSGANFNNLTTQPHTFDLTAQNPITFRYRTQTGAEGVDVTDINPAIYDVNGTITAMPATATLATIQRVYVFQDNVIRIQPGQRFFNNLNEAVTAINSDVFITNDDISDNGLYLGAIVLIRGTTNLSTLAQAIFVPSIGTTTNGSTAAAPLGYTPEDVANKQNNLTVDGTGAKYPTVDAVNTALSAKENILTFSLPIQKAGSTVVMPAATTSIDGYLSSTNFNAFNNKQPAGSYATLAGAETITGVKTYTQPIQGVAAINNNELTTKGQIVDSIGVIRAGSPPIGSSLYETLTGQYARLYTLLADSNTLNFMSVDADFPFTDGAIQLRINIQSAENQYRNYDVTITANSKITPYYQDWVYINPTDSIVQNGSRYELGFRYNVSTDKIDFRVRQTSNTATNLLMSIKFLTGQHTETILSNSNNGRYIDNTYDMPYNYDLSNFKGLISKSGNLYTFGDSQTEHVNSSGNWYTSAGLLLPQFQWTNILSKANGNNLSVTNYGKGSTKMSWLPALPFTNSVFNMTGNLNFDWQGTATVMGGWNNLDASTSPDNDTFFKILERAHIAMIYRLLVDDYGGITHLGWGKNGSAGGTIDSWTTNVTTSNAISVPSGTTSRNIQPFFYGDITGARYRVGLANNQYVQFVLTNKKSVGLFYETLGGGNNFKIEVNGKEAYIGNSQYTNSGGNDLGNYPQTIVLKDLPYNATIRLTSLGDSTYFLAYGYVNKESTLINKRKILYSTTTGNNNGHSNPVLIRAATATYNAVSSLSDYPVFFVNSFNHWFNATDSDPNDPSHLTPIGSQHIAEGYEKSTKLSLSQNNQVVKLDTLVIEAGSSGVVNNGLVRWNAFGFLATKAKDFPQVADLQYLYGSKPSDNSIYAFQSGTVQAFLGLGSNAYTSTAFLPLTGGTLTGALTGTSASFSGNLDIGNIGSVKQLSVGMQNTLARFRERESVNSFSITTNLNDNGINDDLTKSSWRILMGSGTDNFKIGRGAASSGVINDFFTINNVGAATFSSSVTAPTFSGNLTGNATNVTGIVAVVNGGTGSSTGETLQSVATRLNQYSASNPFLRLILTPDPSYFTDYGLSAINFRGGNQGFSLTQNGTSAFRINGDGTSFFNSTVQATRFGAGIVPNINFGYTGAASTSTTAPFLITGGVAYTGTQAGALWYETTNDRFRFYGTTATDLVKTSNNFLLQGTGVRTITANAVGDIVAVTPIVEQFTTVAEVITAITGATYTSDRATITPASSKVFLKGQFYDDGTYTYLAIADNSVRRDGNTTTASVSSGTYTPTLTSGTNTNASVGANLAHWMRVGNEITVAGSTTININANFTASSFSISLPIASNLTNPYDLTGRGTASNFNDSVNNVIINGDTTNDKALVSFTSGASSSATTIYYSFTYTIK